MPSFPQSTVGERDIHSFCGSKSCNCSICPMGVYIVSMQHKTTDILLIFKCTCDPALCWLSQITFYRSTYCTKWSQKGLFAEWIRTCLHSLKRWLGHKPEHVIVCVCWLECFSAVESYLSFSQRKCDEGGTACRQRHEKKKREISINTAEQKAVLCIITWYCVSPLSSGCQGPILTQRGLHFHILTS